MKIILTTDEVVALLTESLSNNGIAIKDSAAIELDLGEGQVLPIEVVQGFTVNLAK